LKSKSLLTSTIILFLIVSTAYYWEPIFGLFLLVVFPILIGWYFLLVGFLLFKLTLIIIEGNKKEFAYLGSISILLLSIYLRPYGIINFEKFEGKDLLIAHRKGGGSCHTFFRLKENNKFIERSRCFSVTVNKGTYELKGDTIFFSDIKKWSSEDYFDYAIIDRSKANQNGIHGMLFRYHKNEPPKKYDLWITKDDLTQ